MIRRPAASLTAAVRLIIRPAPWQVVPNDRSMLPGWPARTQDAVPMLRQFFHQEGFHTHIMSEWESPSRHAELVATNHALVVRIPWAEDYNGKSLVDLNSLEVQLQRHHAAE